MALAPEPHHVLLSHDRKLKIDAPGVRLSRRPSTGSRFQHPFRRAVPTRVRCGCRAPKTTAHSSGGLEMSDQSLGSTTPAPPVDPRRWWALVVIAIAQLMVILDSTVVNIALPSAQRAL